MGNRNSIPARADEFKAQQQEPEPSTVLRDEALEAYKAAMHIHRLAVLEYGDRREELRPLRRENQLRILASYADAVEACIRTTNAARDRANEEAVRRRRVLSKPGSDGLPTYEQCTRIQDPRDAEYFKAVANTNESDRLSRESWKHIRMEREIEVAAFPNRQRGTQESAQMVRLETHNASSGQASKDATLPPLWPVSTHFRAMVLYDFVPEREGDLALKAGQIVFVVTIVDQDWYRGIYTTRMGRSGTLHAGIFPKTHAEKLTSWENGPDVPAR